MSKYRSSIVRFLLSLAVLGLTGIFWLLVKNCPAFFFPGYRTASRVIMKGLSALTGLVPFSIWDIGAALLILAAAVTLIITIVRICRLTRGVGTRPCVRKEVNHETGVSACLRRSGRIGFNVETARRRALLIESVPSGAPRHDCQRGQGRLLSLC